MNIRLISAIWTSALLVAITQTSTAQQLYKSIDNAHKESARSVDINSAETMIITGGDDDRANLWDAKTGKKVKALSLGSNATGVDFHSSDKLFLTAAGDKIVITDAKSFKVKRMLKGHTGEITSATFDPINVNVVSGSKDKKVMIWDGNKGQLVHTCDDHSKEVLCVAISPDSKRAASGSADGQIIIWDTETGLSEVTIESKSKAINDLQYSADGKYLASAGENGNVTIWDAQTGGEVSVFTDLKSASTVAFSPDVQYLAAGGSDSKIFVWDLSTKQVKNQIAGHGKGTVDMVFGDKGTYFVSVGGDGTMKIWDCKKLKIGKKKFVEDGEAPKLLCSPITIMDKNNNGILEAGELAELKFTVSNDGKGKAFNVTAKLALADNIKGISFEKETHIGNLDAEGEQEVIIPITVDKKVETAAGTFILSFGEANGNVPSPVRASFQSRGEEQYNYIMVLENSFSSATGKAEIGAPITLKLRLQNVSKGNAKNIKVQYLLPDNVLAVDKLSEIIPEMAPEEIKELEMQFYAAEGFEGKAVKMMLDIQGAAFTNATDMVMEVAMNEALPGTRSHVLPDMAEVEKLYRGGGDPLKGLNVSKSKDMVIGKYYALIIGIDGYGGQWTPLRNAVNDAKAVEGLLRSKYKFDVFKTLYNTQATRSAIITQLEYLMRTAKPNDNVFIYYSGHGEFNKQLNKGYWVPVDAKSTTSTSSYISNSDLQTFLGGIKSKHTLLVADACFSGDIFRGNTLTVPFEESEKYYKEVHSLPSRQALTSGGIEPVMDGGKDGHSVFAYYFLRTLRGNQSKYFDAGQLYTKIKIPVINNSDQSPKLSPVKKTGDEGGQFIFIKK